MAPDILETATFKLGKDVQVLVALFHDVAVLVTAPLETPPAKRNSPPTKPPAYTERLTTKSAMAASFQVVPSKL